MEEFKNIRLPWNDWKIVKYIGGGAYGKVYEIERNISGVREKAALKIVSRPKDEGEIESYYDNGYDKASIVASYESEIKNYVQEYKLLKELQGQSNIVSCDDFTVIPRKNGIGGDVFIRMELLTSLQQVLRERTLSEKEVIKLGKDISRALILCEKKHIIHRDIKPMNVMVSQFGDYKLGDFGVSKIMDHTTFATAMGTPEYQAPEVVHMEKYGHTADIYSLGIMLYWLLNNRRMPFIGADERITPEVKSTAMERRYRGEKLPAPKNGSAKLKEIVLKACAYRAQDRYASAQNLYDALTALQDGTSDVKESQKKTSAPSSWMGRQETETIGKGQYGYGFGQGQKTDASWGESVGTVGKPAGKKAVRADVTETVGVHNVPKKDPVVAQKNQDWNSVLSQIPVCKSASRKETSGIGMAWLLLIGAGVSVYFGMFWLTVICVCLMLVSISDDGGAKDFRNWMDSNKEKFSNIDDLIENYPEFAKALYYKKCPSEHMLEYLKRKNPVVGREILLSISLSKKS